MLEKIGFQMYTIYIEKDKIGQNTNVSSNFHHLKCYRYAKCINCTDPNIRSDEIKRSFRAFSFYLVI